ncbi:MAG: gliding motility-associated C-terminal domain-containing protein [Ferruginibacter sp.]
MQKIFLSFFILFSLNSIAQAQGGFSFRCSRDTIITNCSISCITLKARIPDIRSSTASYVVNPFSANSGCFNPYVDPGTPGTSTSLTVDDRYSSSITLPFTFPFYGTNYTSLVASTNGYLSFDVALAGAFSHYGILSTGTGLSATSGTPQDLPNTRYDPALIMGPYHDINPATTTSPNRLIKYDVVGTAPHRRWILSFYKMPLFSCTTLFENTHQIVLYEGLGVIEVFISSMQQCAAWNEGRSMVGIQDFNRTNGLMAPGRTASSPPWGIVNMNESWRFVPASGPTLYRKVELFDLAGNLVSTGDTTTIGSQTFEVNFPNVCPSTTTSYVVKSTYQQFNNPGQFEIGLDTIRVVRSSAINATTSISNISCNASNTGAINLVAFGGGGGPFQYSINGGTTFQSTGVFNNLTAGVYNVRIKDAGACVKDTVINITQPAAITGTAATVNATCSATGNGAITVTVSGGVAPLQYSLNGGTTYQASNVFTVTNGTYNVTVKDANNCTRIINNINVALTNNLSLSVRGDTTICSGQNVALATTSNAASYSWTPTSGLANPAAQSPVASPAQTTRYTVTATLGQCSKQASVNINVVNSVTVYAGSDIILISGEQATLNASATGATSYLWTPASGLSATNILNPIAKPTATTLYTLTAKNDVGCTASDDLLVTVIPYCIKVKNAFTPNGDGINDIWQVYDQYDCLKNITVNVFNRYGARVYESRNYRNDWDGRYQGKSLPDGTYYAVVNFTLITGRVVTIKSDLTILR